MDKLNHLGESSSLLKTYAYKNYGVTSSLYLMKVSRIPVEVFGVEVSVPELVAFKYYHN